MSCGASEFLASLLLVAAPLHEHRGIYLDLLGLDLSPTRLAFLCCDGSKCSAAYVLLSGSRQTRTLNTQLY